MGKWTLLLVPGIWLIVVSIIVFPTFTQIFEEWKLERVRRK